MLPSRLRSAFSLTTQPSMQYSKLNSILLELGLGVLHNRVSLFQPFMHYSKMNFYSLHLDQLYCILEKHPIDVMGVQ